MQHFTIDEARAAIPDVIATADQVIPLRANLVEAAQAQQRGAPTMSLADIKALEARLGDLLDGLTNKGIQVKGFAPLLVDFPARHGDREIVLCWLEGERTLEWYHDLEVGFAGRRPIRELETEPPT